MIEISRAEVWGFPAAIRGMRNPMNSWEKSDSLNCNDCYQNSKDYDEQGNKLCENCCGYNLGNNDSTLMKKLFCAGTEHRKYLRMIHVQMDIKAPLYWWKEFDTYKVGTTANSCSTMHKLTDKKFEAADFSFEYLEEDIYDPIIDELNIMRDNYLNYDEFVKGLKDMGFREEELIKKDKIFKMMIQYLPSSYNQLRTIDMNYENVFNIIGQRQQHKLDEWKVLVKHLKGLPFVEEIGNGNS